MNILTVPLTRRQAFRAMLGLGGTVVSAALPRPAAASTEEHPAHPVAPADAVAMLYDSTICTGCKACMPACNEANGLAADTLLSGGIWDMPTGLNAQTKNIIELYQDPKSDEFAFVKKQCMHCLDPACVTGCPFGSLKKVDLGAVTWNSSLCIGCRYCEVACPFEVPQFEWEAWNPKIVKCEFCYEQRLKEDLQPACTAACPTGAVIFGKRDVLLGQAKGRMVATEETFRIAPCGGFGFEILPSSEDASNSNPKTAAILPDIATCAQCLAEVLDPKNQRFGYPFTNCTQCGPRYTIVLDIPYDRPKTTMQKFLLCPSCRREYGSVHDRRFHAQPNACAGCGPRLWLSPAGSDPANLFSEVAAALEQGKVVALKGIGGFQLLVDARNSSAIARLRARKQRDYKPFAMLMPSMECVRRYCEVNGDEESLLRSSAAPIVLLQPKDACDLAPEVAQHSYCIGVMLPSSPMHHLLMAHHQYPLVATSGNFAGEPIAIDNDEGVDRLKDVADLFVLHDRPIARACDDSVVRLIDRPQMLRRARGYAPLPVMVPHELRPVLAVGGHLKSTVAIGFGKQVWLSQHIGDLDSPESRDAFERTIDDLCKLYRFTPR